MCWMIDRQPHRKVVKMSYLGVSKRHLKKSTSEQKFENASKYSTGASEDVSQQEGMINIEKCLHQSYKRVLQSRNTLP